MPNSCDAVSILLPIPFLFVARSLLFFPHVAPMAFLCRKRMPRANFVSCPCALPRLQDSVRDAVTVLLIFPWVRGCFCLRRFSFKWLQLPWLFCVLFPIFGKQFQRQKTFFPIGSGDVYPASVKPYFVNDFVHGVIFQRHRSMRKQCRPYRKLPYPRLFLLFAVLSHCFQLLQSLAVPVFFARLSWYSIYMNVDRSWLLG